MMKKIIITILSQILVIHLAAQNAPVTTAGTVVTGGNSASVNFTVTSFSNIASFNLQINYDPAIAAFSSIAMNPGLGGGFNYNSTAGSFSIGWYNFVGMSLSDNASIFTITFNMISPGQTTLSLFDNGSNCSYGNGSFVILNDIPTQDYYINGSLAFAQPLSTNFTTANLTPPKNTTIQFNDLTTGGATSWDWSFSPSSIVYSSGTNSHSKNPQVQFTNGGLYSVTLTAHNALYTDDETKTDYIRAGTAGLWNGAISNDWQQASNWDNLLIPDNSVNITISQTSVSWPSFSGDFTIGIHCNNLTLANNSRMTVSGALNINAGKNLVVQGNGLLMVGGNWYNAGSFSSGNGTIDFTGNNSATIINGPGINTFNNVIITKLGATLHTEGNININGNLTLNP